MRFCLENHEYLFGNGFYEFIFATFNKSSEKTFCLATTTLNNMMICNATTTVVITTTCLTGSSRSSVLYPSTCCALTIKNYKYNSTSRVYSTYFLCKKVHLITHKSIAPDKRNYVLWDSLYINFPASLLQKYEPVSHALKIITNYWLHLRTSTVDKLETTFFKTL